MTPWKIYGKFHGQDVRRVSRRPLRWPTRTPAALSFCYDEDLTANCISVTAVSSVCLACQQLSTCHYQVFQCFQLFNPFMCFRWSNVFNSSIHLCVSGVPMFSTLQSIYAFQVFQCFQLFNPFMFQVFQCFQLCNSFMCFRCSNVFNSSIHLCVSGGPMFSTIQFIYVFQVFQCFQLFNSCICFRCSNVLISSIHLCVFYRSSLICSNLKTHMWKSFFAYYREKQVH